MAPRLDTSPAVRIRTFPPLARTFPTAITADNYSSQQSRLSVAGEQLGTAGVKPAAPTGVAIRLHP